MEDMFNVTVYWANDFMISMISFQIYPNIFCLFHVKFYGISFSDGYNEMIIILLFLI